jgi:excisionase family DNA binding protein
MMFPYSQEEFWEKMTKVVEAKLTATGVPITPTLLPEKPLLKASEVCTIFQVSKPTLYEWLRQNKIASFKIRSRRYFSREDIEVIIRQNSQAVKPILSRNQSPPQMCV